MNYDKSSIYHNFDFPDAFKADLESDSQKDIVKSVFVSSDEDRLLSLTIPHSGYSFGGDRLSSKEFRPQDCTSFLECSAHLQPNSASSADLYLVKRKLVGDSLHVGPESWLASAGGSNVSLFDINRGDPKLGDIWCVRKFNDEKTKDNSLGYSGHAGMFMFNSGLQRVTISYNRDMPMEGFGLEFRDCEQTSAENQESFFLTRNNTDFSFDAFKDLNVEELPYIYDINGLNSVLSHIDREIVSVEFSKDVMGDGFDYGESLQ